ncbi:MAG: hypothetical protein DHS20C16_23220 [Phycisphaerae bacterium]|nr:MAG: hypothetical protein DHS20C16_23220 [Phycisphaerae bacterium]
MLSPNSSSRLLYDGWPMFLQEPERCNDSSHLYLAQLVHYFASIPPLDMGESMIYLQVHSNHFCEDNEPVDSHF